LKANWPTYQAFAHIIYLIFLFVTDDSSISCHNPFATVIATVTVSESEMVLRQAVVDDWRCSLSGLVIYFSVMAAALWWCVLTITWCLSAGFQWSPEGLDAYSGTKCSVRINVSTNNGYTTQPLFNVVVSFTLHSVTRNHS
jgi:hypothetical protein